MTPHTPTDRPAPPVKGSTTRPYAAPALTLLGGIGAVTAGPDKRPDKVLDQMYGGDGGFLRDGDATS